MIIQQKNLTGNHNEKTLNTHCTGKNVYTGIENTPPDKYSTQ